ncbi:hypothetical protein N7491_005899 [Penicillium cf. griseofulvum]|uniref:INO80 complex subunit B-like conserved region domain-containing protein n=1 Tax=Penicillium cf. griseofulvum TaxID=2972120 RepID=A0A9W9J2S7_9EURO|nr:hypothetical protein N7472_008582 [Penicillium cf. griseofulvum]KAJ5435304.1 hypothetical protein N7491_005899 [Penicillium cf. griseofulvum]KAJ5453137.1 hypothetical protein N7445_001320 [Penicillium cf. griseofulvum]
MSLRRSLRSHKTRDETPEPDANMTTRSTRQTRASTSASALISVSRSELNSGDRKRSLRLTVKMPSSKLREATGAGRAAGRRSVNVFREDPIVSGPRSSRNRKKIVEVATSDEEEIDDQEEDEVDDEDAPGDDDDEEDADADADADGDIDMDDIPLQPPTRRGKISPPSRAKPPKSVEAKEMDMEEEDEDDEDDEEEPISDTDEDAEAEAEDQDEIVVPDVNVDDLDDLDEEDEIDDMDSDALAMQSGKTTKRQRGNLGNDFLQLPMEPQVKKHLTAEERQMRRAEMARRRKNLSEKRNEEEKMDTINRLLKKQAPKRRGRQAAEGADATPGGQEGVETEKADPTLVRWISGPNGCKVSVPEEWLGTPAGRVFGAPAVHGGKMVEEV